MAVQERLSLEAVSADSLLAVEHVHRYELASRLCQGLRIVDLACGSGYGSAILKKSGRSVLGVDNDAATIDMARAAIGRHEDVEFQVADAAEFLHGDLREWDAIVCFEGLEHFPDLVPVTEALKAHAAEGTKLILSVPNSRAFGEDNEYHVTDFGFDQAMEMFDALGDVTILYQFLAEGSLIRGEHSAEAEGEFVLPEHGEPEYANHFIACVNLSTELQAQPGSMRGHLAVAPSYNRHMLNMERANAELWRENARLARERIGRAEAAAATLLFRTAAEQRERAEGAEARVAELEAQVAELQRFRLLFETPRHQAVERSRERVMRSSVAYGLVRGAWRIVRRR